MARKHLSHYDHDGDGDDGDGGDCDGGDGGESVLMFVIFPDTEQYICREELHNHFPSPPGPGDQLAGQSLGLLHT